MRTFLAALLLLTACGDRPARIASEPSPTTSPPARTMLHCGGRLAFPASALDRPANAEDGTDDAAAALRAWLAKTPNEQFANGGGWRELARTDSEVLFAQGTPPAINVLFERRAGTWRWAGSASDCRLLAAPPKGLENAHWAPVGDVGPGDTTFTANVSERGCSSGRSPEGRIEPPLIEYGATTVVVTFFVRPPDGDTQTCQGAPPAPYEVTLREPLGDRELRDGAVHPPRTPTPGI